MFLLEELICKNLSKVEIIGPFGFGYIMQNNTELVRDVSGAEGTHVEHDVPTCLLQHLVSRNRHMVLQF